MKRKKDDLLEDIISAQRELEVAKTNFKRVSNPDLIDMYSHKIIAARSRCDYLIKKAKECGLISSFSLAEDTLFQRYQQ